MFVAAAMLNPLCLALAPLALVFLVGYSYTKRFTWASHWILGFTDGIAAAGGWIAVRGAFEPPAFVLWLALTVWIAGFDLIYACQDVEIDRAQRLHSVPARFGIAARAAAGPDQPRAHGGRAGLARRHDGARRLLLGGLGGGGRRCSSTSTRWCAPGDLSRLDMAFFNVNGYIAVIVLVARRDRAVAVSDGQAKAEAVRAMFTRIAGRYDLMNSVMTGGRHHAWRRLTARAPCRRARAGPALDLATGTGDLALALRRALRPAGSWSAPTSPRRMLREARRKLAARGERARAAARRRRARPALPRRTFACVTSAFLLRNLADLAAGLARDAAGDPCGRSWWRRSRSKRSTDCGRYV